MKQVWCFVHGGHVDAYTATAVETEFGVRYYCNSPHCQSKLAGPNREAQVQGGGITWEERLMKNSSLLPR